MIKKKQRDPSKIFVDPLLLGTCLNNLSYLYFFEREYQLSFNTNLRNFTLSQQSIKELQKQNKEKNKKYIQQLAVLLINSLKLMKKIVYTCEKQKLYDLLQQLIDMQNQMNYENQDENNNQSDSKFFSNFSQQYSYSYDYRQETLILKVKKLKIQINKLGYNASLKYLGKQSYFSQFFQPQKSQFRILKCKSQEPINFINRNQFSLFQSETLKKLDQIQKLLQTSLKPQNRLNLNVQRSSKRLFLSTKNSQEIIHFDETNSENNIELYSIKSTLKIPLNEPKKEIEKFSYFFNLKAQSQLIFEQNKWKVQMRLYKAQNQTLGTLEIFCNNILNDHSFYERINEKQLKKILNLRSLEDTLPYEFSINQVCEDFIQICIKSYFSISQNGKVSHFPRAQTLTKKPILVKFLAIKCYVFFFHIRANNFRISISPLQQSGSVYLNVELNNYHLEKLFDQLIDPVPKKIRTLFETQLSKKNKRPKDGYIFKKSLKIRNKQKVSNLVIEIVQSFQQFLKSQQNDIESNGIFGLIQKDEQYWKFIDQGPTKLGSFLKVKFNKYSKSFDIYGQQYYRQVQKGYSYFKKGRFQFKSNEFRQIFGFQPQYGVIKDKLKRISEIISYKYLFLKENQSGSHTDTQIYEKKSQIVFQDRNFMVQKSFNEQSFHIEMICNPQDLNYLCLIIFSIVTLGNIFPIGIKVSLYDPNQIKTKAFFINIFSQDWSYQSLYYREGQVFQSKNSQLLTRNQLMFKPFKQKFPQEQNYFLTLWLRISGFKLILQKVLDKNSRLYYQRNFNSIINWNQIFQN